MQNDIMPVDLNHMTAAFNHVTFNAVDTNVDSATYGRLTGDHLPRNIQLGLKLYF